MTRSTGTPRTSISKASPSTGAAANDFVGEETVDWMDRVDLAHSGVRPRQVQRRHATFQGAENELRLLSHNVRGVSPRRIIRSAYPNSLSDIDLPTGLTVPLSSGSRSCWAWVLQSAACERKCAKCYSRRFLAV